MKKVSSNDYNLNSLSDPLRNHIIGIGIDDYKDSNIANLSYCASDIEQLGEILIENFAYFEEDRFIKIISKNVNRPTRSNILELIRNKVCCLKSQDNVIIYFAGHGISHEGMFYFATYDSKRNDYSTFISFADILKILDRQDVKHFFFIIDACYSGQILNIHRDLKEDDFSTNPDYWKKIYTKKSVWVLTSGAMEKVPDESIFADRMRRILKSFGRNEKPIMISDLKNEIVKHFGNKVKQTPIIGHLNIVEGFENIGGEFVFLPRKKEEKNENINHNPTSNISSKIVLETGNEIKDNIEINPPRIEISKIPKPSNFDINNQIGDKIESLNSLDIEKSELLFKRYNLRKHAILIFLVILVLTLAINNDYSSDKKNEVVENEEPPLSNSKPIEMSIITGLIETSKIQNSTNKTERIRPKSIKKNKLKHPVLSAFTSTVDSTIDKTNIVFSGSFQNKENADRMLEQLKEIGFENAEIIMKDKLSYAIVISGFHNSKQEAKLELKRLREKGIEVYSSEKYWNEIYRADDSKY